MKILLACEHFFPDGGGVAKYMQELSLGLKRSGHEITVATTYTAKRIDHQIDGLLIKDFKIHGNLVNGMYGDILSYQKFVLNEKFDLLIVMAAQQWTFDALISIFEDIKSKILHIPCGYSYLGEKKYENYYSEVSKILPKIHALIYHSSNYKDINLAKKLLCKNISIIPAGVNLNEFKNENYVKIRSSLNINSDDFIFINIGAPAVNKGQLELIKAYRRAHFDTNTTLVLNSDFEPLRNFISIRFFKEFAKFLLQKSKWNIVLLSRLKLSNNKKIVLCNLERMELVKLLKEANLFVFPSKIEYSPLVIFESMAAGVPFIANPVGNCEEIIEWTNAGILIKDTVKKGEFRIANVKVLKNTLEALSKEKDYLKDMGKRGQLAIYDRFNWNNIIDQFNNVIKEIYEKN